VTTAAGGSTAESHAHQGSCVGTRGDGDNRSIGKYSLARRNYNGRASLFATATLNER